MTILAAGREKCANGSDPLLNTLQSVVHSLSQQLAEAQAAEAAAAALARKAIAECAAVHAQQLRQSAITPAQPGHVSTNPGQEPSQPECAMRTAEASPSAVEAPRSGRMEADLPTDNGSSPVAATDPESGAVAEQLAADDRGCISCAALREERAEMARMMRKMEGIVQQVYGNTIASQLDPHDAIRLAPAASSPVADPSLLSSVGGAPASVVSAALGTPATAQHRSDIVCPGSAEGSPASTKLAQSEANSMGKARMAEGGLPGSALLLSPVAADQTPCAIVDTPHRHQAGSHDGDLGSSILRHATPGGRAQWLAGRVAAEVAQLCASSATPQHANAGGSTQMSPAMQTTPAGCIPIEGSPDIGDQLAASDGVITAVDVQTPTRVRAMVQELQEAVLTLTVDNDRLLGLLTAQVRPLGMIWQTLEIGRTPIGRAPDVFYDRHALGSEGDTACTCRHMRRLWQAMLQLASWDRSSQRRALT